MAIVTVLAVVTVIVVGTVLANKTVIHLSGVEPGIKRKELVPGW